MDDARVTGSVIRPWVVTWTSDEAGRLVQIDGAWTEKTGQSSTDAIGTGWRNTLHPDDRARVDEAFAAANTAKVAFRTESRIYCRDGTYRHVIAAGHPWFDGEGLFRGYYGTLIDDDDSHRAEAAVRRNEEKYRKLLDALDEGFVVYELIFDAEGKCVDLLVREVNRAFVTLVGTAIAPGQRYLEVFPGLSRSMLDFCAKVERSGVPQRFEMRGENTGRWFDTFVMRAGGEGSRQIACLFSDINDRKMLEEERRDSEERQRYLLRLNDVLWPVADSGAIELEACRVLAEYLKADRVSYAEFDASGHAAGAVQFSRDGLSAAGQRQPGEYNPVAVERYRRGEPMICNDTAASPGLGEAQRQAFARESIAALAGVPVMKHGKLVARMVVHQSKPRTWSARDVDLIGETAQRIWAAAERSRTEVALRESERDLRLAQAVSKTGSWRDDYVTGKCVWSAETCRMLGQPEDTLKTLELFLSVVHPDDRARAAGLLPESRTGSAVDIEYRVVVEGKVRWIRERGEIVFDGEGRALRGFGTVQDITDRKDIEEALEESRKRQAFLLRLSDTIRVLSDPLQAQVEACRVLGGYLGASRVFFAETDEAGFSFSGPQYLNDVGPALATWQLDDFEYGLLDKFRLGLTAVCNDVAAATHLTPVQKRNHASERIGARITVPLLKDGNLAGRLIVHQSTPREWTNTEIVLAEDTADRLWSSIKRSRAEQALRQSEEDLRRAQAVAQIGNWHVDFVAGTLSWSAETRRIFRVGEGEQVDYAGFLKLVHPGDRHMVDVSDPDVVVGSPFDIEYRIMVGGEVRWLRERGDVVVDANGKPLNAFGTVQDITDRKAVEIALREIQQRQGLFLRLGDTLRPLSDAGQIKREACRVLGEELGANRVFYAEASEAGFTAGGEEFAKGVRPMPVRWRLDELDAALPDKLKGGTAAWRHDVTTDPDLTAEQKAAHAGLEIGACAAVPLVKQGAQVSWIAVHFRDAHRWTAAEIALISETAERVWTAVDRARVDARLRNSERDLRRAQAIGKIGNWRVNVQREEIYWSAETCRIFGVPESTPKSYSLFLSVIHPDDRDRVDRAWRAGTAGAPYDMEYRVVVGDEVRWISERGELERDRDGTIIAVFGTTQDITDQKTSEQVLRESEAQKAYLLKLSDTLRPLERAEDIQLEACRILGAHLGANRVLYAEHDETGYSINGPEYLNGVGPVPRRWRIEDYDSTLLERYKAGRALWCDDVRGNPLLSEQQKAVFAAEDTVAWASAPVLRNGALSGRLIVTQSTARQWKTPEIRLIEETADRLRAAVERSRIEGALRRSEAELRRAQTVSKTGSWNHDYLTGELTWSAETSRMFGVPEGVSLHIRQYLELVHPEDRHLVDVSVPEATFDTPFDLEYRVIVNGDVRWVRERGEIEFDADGRPVRDFGAVQDFTDRKLVEQALAESEARHAYLLKLSDVLRPAADPLELQRLACGVLGETIGASRVFFAAGAESGATDGGPEYLDGVPPVRAGWTVNDFDRGLMQLYLRGQTAVRTDIANDPSLTDEEKAIHAAEHIAARVSAPLLKQGNLVGRLIVHQARPRAWTPSEITLIEETADRLWAAVERARSEAALRASERELKRAQSVARTGSWSYDYETEIIWWSAETCRIFGVPEGTTVAYDDFKRFVHPDDYARLRLTSPRRCPGPAYDIDYRIIVGGSVHWVRERGEVEYGRNGIARREYGTVQDITERRATEQALHDSEARHAYLLTLSDALRPLTDPLEIQTEACRALGHRLGANRVVYAESDPDGRSMTGAEYVSGVAPSEPVWNISDYDDTLLSRYMQGRAIWCDDVSAQPGLEQRQLANYAAESIGSWAAAPLLKDGRLVGRLIVNLAAAHKWLATEIALIEETAERLWAAVERARAVVALRESERELSRAQSVARIGSFRGDYTTGRLVWSAETRRIFGVPQEKQVDMAAFLAIVHPDDREFARLVPTPAAEGKFFEVEYRIVVNGAVRWVRERGEYEFDGSRLVAGFGTVQDITDRRHIEQALYASEARQAFLLMLSDTLRPLSDPVQIQLEACRILGQHLRANRVIYTDNDDAGNVVCGPQYVNGVRHMEGRWSVASVDPALAVRLREGRAVVQPDVSGSPDLPETLKVFCSERQINAWIIAPLVKDGDVLFRLSVHSAAARDWTQDEIILVEETAERLWATVERARAETRLRQSEERQAYLLRLSDALRPLGDPLEIQAEACRVLGQYLHANRVFYGETEADGSLLVGPQYVDGVSRADRHIPSHRLPKHLLELYRQGRSVVDHDVAGNPDLSEEEKQINARAHIGARVAVPLIKNGEAVARLVVQQATARFWSPEEVNLIVETADRTWSAMERAKAESALRDSEAVFRALGESVPSFLWMSDAVGEQVYENPAAAKYIGRTSVGGKQAPWRDIYHPDDIPALELQWAKALAVGEALQFEARIRRHDGVYRWFAGQMVPTRDSYGRIVRWVGTANDIDDRKRRERNTALLAELQDDMARYTSTDDIMMAVGAKLASFVNVSVGYLVDVDSDVREVRLLNQLANRKLPEFPARFFFSDYVAPEMVRAWSNGYAVAIDDISKDPRVDGAAFERLAIGSFVVVPFVRGGFLNALMMIHDAAARHWGDDEVELFRELANRLFPRLERARAESALRESEAVFRTIGESLPDMLWLSESDGTVIYENAVVEEFCGESFIGRPPDSWIASYHPDDVPELAVRWARALAEGEALYYEARRRCHDGAYRWFSGRTVPARDEHGHIVRWVGTMTDIDDRKRRDEQKALLAEIQDDLVRLLSAEQIMKSVGEKLSALLNVSIGYLVDLNPADDRIELQSHFGKKSRETYPETYVFCDYVSPDVVQAWSEDRLMVVADTQNDTKVSAEAFAKMGIMAIVAVPFLRHGVLNALMVVHDVSPRVWLDDEVELIRDVANRLFPRVERARADAALRESEERFRQVFEHSATGISISDLEGRLLQCNPAYCRLMGYSEEEIRGMDFMQLVHPEDREANRLETALLLAGEAPNFDFDFRYVRKDGSTVWAEKVVSLVRDETGAPVSMVALVTDVTERRRTVAELREADRRKDEFIATAAHELRNPLVPIHNGVHVLRSLAGGNGENPNGKLLDMMDRQVAHLVRLVDDLVEISRVTRGKIELRREPVDLSAIVRGACETCQPLVAAKNHELEVHLPDDRIVLDADPVRLVQVFTNLLNNAIKFTAAGGRIAISAVREGGWAVVTIRDDGIGIPAAVLPRVFDLFVQDQHSAIQSGGGLGIGLALVRNLVEKHGGTVEAQSPGRDLGSEFIVRLPLAAAPGGEGYRQ